MLDTFVVQVDDAKDIKNTEIAKELSLPPVKLHCSSKLQITDYQQQIVHPSKLKHWSLFSLITQTRNLSKIRQLTLPREVGSYIA